ncbi:leucine-rich repeat domain-containing protein [Roseinatronobacter sp.]|uniref:leucine-rich repeat domain-containing protein n=1 Tax=Roseinatronobacter sp. TaxID=1945755 RepID=UPI0025FE1A76|nr:leucine-rich repeat domain-containing protein [Roseibaca sp.]
MLAAKEAYEAALREIDRVVADGKDELILTGDEFHPLQEIPPEIAALTWLEELRLRNTQIKDLTPLAGLTGLQTLWLDGTNVIELAPLSELTELRTLRLNNTKITDLSPLSKMTRLHVLWLYHTPITDIASLAGMKELQTLRLDDTGTVDLAPLKGMIGLQSLVLDNTKIADLAPLAGMAGLRTLALSGSKAIDLRPLARLDKLGKHGTYFGLSFSKTPATAHDTRLAELDEIYDSKDRTRKTLAYLRSLPPWPEPYTPAATPDGSPPKPIGGVPERKKIKTAQTQIQHLIRNATVTRVTAQAFASQIEEALRDVPATHGNQLAEPLQTMQEFADALRNLAPANEPTSDPLQRAHLELRISQLEQLVDRLTRQLADETKAREAAEALAKKEGFLSNYKQGAGKAAGVATVSLATVGVPTAAVFFLGVEHPLVQAFLTVIGRLPKS